MFPSNHPLPHPIDPRLPQWPTQRATKPSDRVLVVYSGPTDLPPDPDLLKRGDRIELQKQELYRVNFEHFLRYGVQCRTQDTVLVVTEEVAPLYRERVDHMHRTCQEQFGNKVLLIVRTKNECYDLETVRRVMHDGVVDIDAYDYFVYANCGTSGRTSIVP